MSITYKTKLITSTPYSVSSNDEVIFVNVDTPSYIILPAINNYDDKHSEEYRAYYIKDYSGNSKFNPITISTANGKTIDGISFAMLNTGYSHIQIIYDGQNWKTIS
jgi:hypothetical protein